MRRQASTWQLRIPQAPIGELDCQPEGTQPEGLLDRTRFACYTSATQITLKTKYVVSPTMMSAMLTPNKLSHSIKMKAILFMLKCTFFIFMFIFPLQGMAK